MVEVLEAGAPVPAGTVGDLVCTGLLNADMPLVRYRVGDRGALAPADEGCRCGRTLPTLATVEGRVDDVLLTPDGRRIGRLDPVFKADLPVREVISALHVMSDLTLGLGEVVHDYLKS